jgi:hypothetical protein
MRRWVGLLVVAAAWGVIPMTRGVPAFPGAAGFGAETPGGRGGAVYYVTSLADAGPGTLREQLNRSGPRTILFALGGTIRLQSPLMLTEPYVTIAGQSAPGGGITIKRELRTPGQTNNTIFRVATHDVVIRYLRFRGGTDTSNYPGAYDTGLAINPGSSNVVIDHCSVSWNTDENIAFGGNSAPVRDVTIQWSISSEVLNTGCSANGCPGKGGLLADPPGVERISIHHNLFASNWDRNPTIGGSGIWDVVNNVIYNSASNYASGFSDWDCDGSVGSPLLGNYVANFIQPGPSSQPNQYPLALFLLQGGPGLSIFHEGNAGVPWWWYCQRRAVTFPACTTDSISTCDPATQQSATRHTAPAVGETNPATSLLRDAVVDGAGATRPHRDSVDQCVTASVRNNTGQALTALGQGCASFPADDPGVPPVDSDQDGMADLWEQQYGLNPTDPADGAIDSDLDVYTNLEEFLNETHPRDTDGDGVGNVRDCAPTDPSAFAEPPEVQGLRFAADHESILWDSLVDQTGPGVSYDLLRAANPAAPVGSGFEVCLASHHPNATIEDPASPAPATGLSYLVRARNVCGIGTWGAQSNGQPRLSTTCP